MARTHFEGISHLEVVMETCVLAARRFLRRVSTSVGM